MSDSAAPAPNVLPEHVRFIRGIARSLLFDEQEAEDAVQDTLLRALEQPPQPGNIRGWLRVVVRNFALRKKREERRRKYREMKQTPPDHIASPEEVAARLEAQRRVLDAVRELAEPYRSTIAHRYLDDLTPEEIAQRLGIPLETVRTRLKRALRMLRGQLGEGNEESAWAIALLPLLGLRLPGAGDAVPATFLGGLSAKVAAGVAVLGAGALLWFAGSPERAPSRAASDASTALRATEDALATTDSRHPCDARGTTLFLATGIVHDTAGEPVAGARVHVGAAEVATGADGGFRVRAGHDGRVHVTVQKQGYLPAEATLDAMDPEAKKVTLVRGAPVSVVVLDRERKPVADALVLAAHREERGVAGLWWSRRSLALGEATSDAEGLANVAVAPLGPLEIRIDDPRFAAWRTEIVVGGTDPVRCEALLSTGGTASGRVTDAEGRPVAGARVYGSNRPALACVTREDGSYDLTSLVEGENRILAEADGFGTGFFGASLGWGKPVPVRIVEGQAVAGVDIVLPVAVVATGRVVDSAGNPIEGVRVESTVGPCLGRPVRAETGRDGRFAIGPHATTDGHPVRLTFAIAGYAIDAVSAELPTQPGALDLGDVVGRRLGTLRGRVLDLDGEPIGRGRVEVASGGRAALVGADGTFVLEGLAPGLLLVQATAWNPLRKSDAVPVSIDPGADVSGAVLELEPMRSIRGHVLSAQGSPCEGVTVAVTPEGATEPVLARAATDPSGAFELADLPGGAYRVGILRAPISEETTAPDSRVEFSDDPISVRVFVPGLDDVEPPEEGTFLAAPPPVRAETGTEDLRFVLPGRVTAVDGRVLSRATGEPILAFEVSFIEYWKGLVPKGSETLEVRDPAGRFQHALREGSWAAEVTAPGCAPFRTAVFSTGEHAKRDLGTIRLGPGGRLRGTVLDAFGEPVAYARMYLLGPQLQTNRRPIFTDAQGSYEAAAIPPGTYTVFALSPRHPLGIVRNVEIKENEASPLDVRLSRPSPVMVVVTDEAGRPVAGAEVSYTCDALMPLTSRVLRSHEPPGWGGFRTDGQGRLFKPYFPAARVHFRVQAQGFARAMRVAELREDRETVVEIRLERQR